jgi:hypothetical protein
MRNMKKRKENQLQFAICITDSEPDLERRKVYQVLPDALAARNDYLRIVDESGEDYLYPASYFVFIRVPKQAEIALRRAS